MSVSLPTLFLAIIITVVSAQCPVGCRLCDGSQKCSECRDWFHLDDVNNICKVGEIVDRYTFTAGPTYEGNVNGHPRHRLPVRNAKAFEPGGMITDMLYIRNGNTAATLPIFGVNHFYWNIGGDSGLYLWPQMQNGSPRDYSTIFTPPNAAPIEIFDVRSVPTKRFKAKYTVKSAPIYEGIVGGFPRYNVSVDFITGPKGLDSLSGLGFYIFNRVTGNSLPIHGVHHWLWPATNALHFWPVDAANKLNQAAVTNLLTVGTTFWIIQMREDCTSGCLDCEAGKCIECSQGLHIDKDGFCRVGSVMDSYMTTSLPVYEGVVNGHPRHRVLVDRNFPQPRTVMNAAGYTGSQVYLKNRATGTTKRIFGINHFWWIHDSGLYVWPVRNGQAVGDWSSIYTSANTPLDVIDFSNIAHHYKRAHYRATGGFVYEGVVHGLPRFRIPVTLLFRNSHTADFATSRSMFLFNEDTGASYPIWGVNHWLWPNSHLYIFGAQDEKTLQRDVIQSLISNGNTFWVVQYDNICPVAGCKYCADTTTCTECEDFLHLDTRNNQCKVGKVLDRYSTTAAPAFEGTVNGYPRFRIPVATTKPHVSHGLVSDKVYVRNVQNANTKKIYGVNHLYWSFDSALYLWPAETVAGIDPAGSWSGIYDRAGNQVEIYDVAALQPSRFLVKYRSTTGLAYEGVVNGFPRYRLGVSYLSGSLKAVTDGLTRLDFYVFNEGTGDSYPLFGVNHWYWNSNELYLWPVELPSQVNHAPWNKLLPAGSTFWIMQMRDVSCGNGLLEGIEECDDKNLANGDGCDNTCHVEKGYRCPNYGKPCEAVCGDNLVVRGEACDDGNLFNTDGCTSLCVVEDGWRCPSGINCAPICGDRLLRGLEACDDNNTISGDGCSADCRTVEANFTCPTPGQPCRRTAGICGNGIIEVDENCDDGNRRPRDGCSASCQREDGWNCTTPGRNCTTNCGDGLRRGAETCDDNNRRNGDGCSDQCTWEPGFRCPGNVCINICGDGRRVRGETCDDNNTKSFDGCDRACAVEPGWACPTPGLPCIAASCGDSLIVGSEECDDGNNKTGDGCSNLCKREAGWICTFVGKFCAPICGDKIVVGKEACDDGDATDGDGCSANCTVETGWNCPPGKECSPICGDGLIFPPEICDDGNLVDGDSCSSSCTAEEGYECNTDYPGPCCPLVPFDLNGFDCNKGIWVVSDSLTTVTVTDELTFSEDIHFCGYVEVDSLVTIENVHIIIEGGLLLKSNAHIRFLGKNSSITVLPHCEIEDELEDRFGIENATISVEEIDWEYLETDDDDVVTNAPVSKIVVDGCAIVGNGSFYFQAENIPRGSNSFPLIVSLTGCIKNTNDDEDEAFDNLDHSIPGTCSDIETEFAEVEKLHSVDVVLNMKHLCHGSIAAIVVCVTLGVLILLALAFIVLGGSGGGGSDVYTAL